MKLVQLGLITVIAGLLYSIIWIGLVALILIHINATTTMWIIFWIQVPLRIAIELTSKRFISAINKEEE